MGLGGFLVFCFGVFGVFFFCCCFFAGGGGSFSLRVEIRLWWIWGMERWE